MSRLSGDHGGFFFMTGNQIAVRQPGAKRARRLPQRVNEFNELLSALGRAKAAMESVQQNLKSPCARKAAARFIQQIDLTLGMVLLPYEIVMYLEGFKSGFAEAFQIVLESIASPVPPPPADKKPSATKTKQERDAEREEAARTAMTHFFNLEGAKNGTVVTPWLFAMVVYIWTAFECIATDLWESTLNENAIPTAQNVLSSLTKPGADEDGLSGQHIRVGLAAKYGFDLRHCLGTLLKSKFDFTSTDGIITAYTKAFGSCDALDAFKNELRQLELIRNLIVHRGGVVDDKFLSLSSVKARKGNTLRVTLPQVASYLKWTILGAGSLLEMVDERVSANSRRTAKRKPSENRKSDGSDPSTGA